MTVQDLTVPTIVCAPPKTVECTSAWSFDAPTASDTCGFVTLQTARFAEVLRGVSFTPGTGARDDDDGHHAGNDHDDGRHADNDH